MPPPAGRGTVLPRARGAASPSGMETWQGRNRERVRFTTDPMQQVGVLQ